jgi:hypothetical protein
MNEQQNIQSETPVEYNTNLNSLNEYEKPKKNPTGGIIVAVLVLIIVGLGIYIAYDKGYLDKIFNKSETKEKESANEVKERLIDTYIGKNENKITDEAIITKINSKIEKMSVPELIEEYRFEEYSVQDGPHEENVWYILDYSFDTYGKKVEKEHFNDYLGCECTADVQNEDGTISSCLCAPGRIKELEIVSKEDVLKVFKEIYGYETDKVYVQSYYRDGGEYFPTLGNPVDNLIRYKFAEASLISHFELVKANERYTEDDKYYHVYFNFGIDVDGNLYDGRRDFILADKNSKSDLKMTDENSDDFAILEITFKKVDNDFFFDNIKILKDKEYNK